MTAMKNPSRAATMPTQHYPRRDSNPKKRTEPWQIRSSSVRILTSILSRRPDHGIARPSRKWLLRQEKRMRDFPDELLSIAGKRKYNRMTTSNAILETMEGMLYRLTGSSSSTVKGKGKGTNVNGQEDLTRWKKSNANLCNIHEVLDSHLVHRIFMAIAHETSTLSNVLRGFVSNEISVIEKNTREKQIGRQKSRRQSETTLIKNEKIARLAALLQRLDSITAYWIDYKTFEKNFHGGKPYDESGKVTKVENRCDACILAAIGANGQALCDLRALALYRREKRCRPLGQNEQLNRQDDCRWPGTTDSTTSLDLGPKSSKDSEDLTRNSGSSTTARSQSSHVSDGSSVSRPEEPVLLRYLDGWISALKKSRSTTCRAESEDLGALLFSYEAKIEVYRNEHARLRNMGSEGPTTFREVRVMRAVSRSTGRRREELFDLVPSHEEVEFGTHTRYGTPIAYLVPSTIRENRSMGPKYYGYCTSDNHNLEEPHDQNVHHAGSAMNSEIEGGRRNINDNLQFPGSPTQTSLDTSMQNSQDFTEVMRNSSSSVYSQDDSDEVEHACNKNIGAQYNSVENINVFLDGQEARRLAQSETVVRDWQARCVLENSQPVPSEQAEDGYDEDYMRLRGLNKNNSYITELTVTPCQNADTIPATPFTYRSAVPPPLSQNRKASDGSSIWSFQVSGTQANYSRHADTAFANRKGSDTSIHKSALLKHSSSQCRFCSGSGCRSCSPFTSGSGCSSVLVSNSPSTDLLAKDYTCMPSESRLPWNYDDCVVDFDDECDDAGSEWTDVSVNTRGTRCSQLAPVLAKRHEALTQVIDGKNSRPRPQTIREEIEVTTLLDDDSMSYVGDLIDEKLGRLQDFITPEQDELIMNLPNMNPLRTSFCKEAFGETSTVYKFPVSSESSDLLGGMDRDNHSPQLSPRQLAQDRNSLCPPTPQLLDKRLYNTDRASYRAWKKNIRSLENIRDTPLKPSDSTVDSYTNLTSRYDQGGTPTKSCFDSTKPKSRLATVLEPDGLAGWERHGIEHPRDWEEIGVSPVGHVPTHDQLAPPPLKIRPFLERVTNSIKATAIREDEDSLEGEKQVDHLESSQIRPQKPSLQISSCNQGASTSGYNVATRGRSASIIAGELWRAAPERPPRSPDGGSARKESYATQITDLLAQYHHESQRDRAR